MSSKIKLLYYDLRGRGEIIRYVLLAGNIDFEEERIERSQWPSVKDKYKLPTGQIPTVTLPDGFILNESIAIARYFANQAGLVGSTFLENYQCDRAVMTLEDLFKSFALIYHEKNEEKKLTLQLDLKNMILPKFLQILTNYLNETNGPFFLGNKPSLADLHLVNILENAKESDYQAYPEIRECRRQILERYPAISKYQDQHPNMAI